MNKEHGVMTVWDKLRTNAYRNPEPVPQAPRKPRLLPDATPTQVREYADELEAYDDTMKTHREQMAAYYARSAALEAEFRRDLEVTYDMVGHVKADLLYGKAYEMGHSAGFQEVASYYSDLVELVQ
jgi:hypothetical protein